MQCRLAGSSCWPEQSTRRADPSYLYELDRAHGFAHRLHVSFSNCDGRSAEIPTLEDGAIKATCRIPWSKIKDRSQSAKELLPPWLRSFGALFVGGTKKRQRAAAENNIAYGASSQRPRTRTHSRIFRSRLALSRRSTTLEVHAYFKHGRKLCNSNAQLVVLVTVIALHSRACQARD